MTPPAAIKPLHLQIGASRILAVALFVAHAGAIVIVCALSLPPPARVALAAAVLIHGAWVWREHVRHEGAAIREFRVRPDATMEVRADGGWREAALRTADVVQPWFTVLVFRVGRGTRSVLLLPYNVAAEDFRRLRVYLNLGALQTDTSA